MKKIFAFFCVLAIAFTASAAQPATVTKQMKSHHPLFTYVKHSIDQAKKAPQLTNEVLFFDYSVSMGVNFSVSLMNGDHMLVMNLNPADLSMVGFPLKEDTAYTSETMLSYYLTVSKTGERLTLDTVSVLYSMSETELIHFEGVYQVSGGDLMHYVYDDPIAPTEFDTIDVAMNEPTVRYSFTPADEMYEMPASVTFSGENDNIAMNLTYETEALVGKCGALSNAIVTTKADNRNWSVVAELCNAEVTLDEDENPIMEAYVYSYDGHCYHTTFHFQAPTAKTTIDMVATNLKIDASMFDMYLEWFGMGEFTADANNDEYTVSLGFASPTQVTGLYDEITYGSIFATDGTSYEIYNVSETIEVNKEKKTLKGSVLCFGDVQFNFDWSFVAPAAADTITLDLTKEVAYFYQDGQLVFNGYTENNTYGLLLAINPNEENIYTEEHIDPYNTYIYEFDPADPSMYIENYSDIILADLVIEPNERDGSCNLKGYLLCNAEVAGHITRIELDVENIPNGNYQIDNDQDISLHFDNYEVDDSSAEWFGNVYVTAEDKTTGAFVAIELWVSGATLTPGEYLLEFVDPAIFFGNPGTATACTGLRPDYTVLPSYVTYINEEGYMTDTWCLTEGTVTVAEDNIVVEAVNSKNRTIHVTMGNVPESVENVNGNNCVNKVLHNGQLLIRKGNKTFNALGQELK